MRRALAIFGLLVFLLLGGSAIAAPALPKGTLATPRFKIVYSPGARKAAATLASQVETARADVARALGTDWDGVTEIRLGVRRSELDALAAPRTLPHWAQAVAFPDENLLFIDAVTFLGPEGPSTLRHELCHVALGRFGKGWPHWLQEGLAQHVTGERFLVDPYFTLFKAMHEERLIDLSDLEQGWPDVPADVQLAYAESLSFVDFLEDEYGPGPMRALLLDVKAGEGFPLAFGKAFHSSVAVEEHRWQKVLPRRYAWLPFNAGTDLLYALMGALCVVAYARRQQVKGQRLAEMDAEAAAEEATRRLLALEAEPSETEAPETDGSLEAEASVSHATAAPDDVDELPGKRVLH